MCNLRQAFSCCAYNFRQWRGSVRVGVVFILAFILCFLLTERTASFARNHGTYVQILEPFIWSFGDGTNIMLASVLLLLLFADLPFVGAGTPFYLMRTTRRVWVTGQALYILTGTGVYVLFVLAATCVLCMPVAFGGNQWSEAAALMGYSGFGTKLGVPTDTTTLEMSRPIQAAAVVCVLLLLYMLAAGLLMLAVSLRAGRRAAFAAVLLLNLWGLLLEPELFARLLRLPEGMLYRANVLTVWCSPLNQATYPLHSFGYNNLPTLGQSLVLFICCAVLLYAAAVRAVRRFQFTFAGTEQ